jgi:cytochrome P450
MIIISRSRPVDTGVARGERVLGAGHPQGEHHPGAGQRGGYGVHLCLGRNLTRVELQIAIPAPPRRLPDLRPAVDPAGLEIRPRLLGVEELPVTR